MNYDKIKHRSLKSFEYKDVEKDYKDILHARTHFNNKRRITPAEAVKIFENGYLKADGAKYQHVNIPKNKNIVVKQDGSIKLVSRNTAKKGGYLAVYGPKSTPKQSNKTLNSLVKNKYQFIAGKYEVKYRKVGDEYVRDYRHDYDFIYSILNKFKGKHGYFQIRYENGSEASEFRKIPLSVAGRNNLKKVLHGLFFYYDNEPSLIRFIEMKKTETEYDFNQIFKDDENKLCFYNLVVNKFNEIIKSSTKDDGSISTYGKTFQNALIRFQEKININGVNFEKIQELCNEFYFNFSVYDLFQNSVKKIFCSKKSRFSVSAINSRYNHLSEYVDKHNEIVEVTEEELKELSLKPGAVFLGNYENPNCVMYDKTYKLKKTNMQMLINDELKKLHKFKIATNSEEFKYIHHGAIYTPATAINKELHKEHKTTIEKFEYDAKKVEEYQQNNFIELDYKQAYINVKKCDFYEGFPSIMQMPTKCDRIHGIGYYQFEIIKFNQHAKLFEAMGLNDQSSQFRYTYVLPSPEIKFLMQYMDIKIISGTWSKKPLDKCDELDLNNLIEVVDGKTKKGYGLCVGKAGALNNEARYSTYCDDIENAKNIFSNNIVYCDTVNKIVQTYEDKSHKRTTSRHVSGFYPSYCRIRVYQQMMKFKFEHIIMYKLDGFTVVKNDETQKIANKIKSKDFRFKPAKIDYATPECIYMSASSCESYKDGDLSLTTNNIETEYLASKILLSGAGGTGKTHTIMNMFDKKHILFTSTDWLLSVKKHEEFDIKALSIAQVAGINTRPYGEEEANQHPPIIFVDEITKVSNEVIKKLEQIYKYSKIILCGDIKISNNQIDYYQCSYDGLNNFTNIRPQTIQDYTQIEFTTNYRCKDEELLKRLNNLRDYMKKTNFDTKKITAHVKRIFRDRKGDINDYTKNDYVLCSLVSDVETKNKNVKSQVKHYTELLNKKDNKYYVISHSNEDVKKRMNGDNEHHLKGEIIQFNKKPASAKYQKRSAFTIHSFQGVTVRNPSKLYIDTNHIFTPQQLYTALSRVEHLNQIVLI